MTELETAIRLIGELGALLIAIYTIWKIRQMTPKEALHEDADASKSFAEAAKLAGDQFSEALKRINALEDCARELEIRLNAEIKKRDKQIDELTKGIKILTAQLVEKDILPLWIPPEY